MANEEPIHAGLIAALTGKLRQTAEIWFGPSAAPPQVAPATNSVRSFDNPVGVNVQFTPRADEPATPTARTSSGTTPVETRQERICDPPEMTGTNMVADQTPGR